MTVAMEARNVELSLEATPAVVHEPRVAAHAEREVAVRDGRVNLPNRLAS